MGLIFRFGTLLSLGKAPGVAMTVFPTALIAYSPSQCGSGKMIFLVRANRVFGGISYKHLWYMTSEASPLYARTMVRPPLESSRSDPNPNSTRGSRFERGR
jgi:hypothetical protein